MSSSTGASVSLTSKNPMWRRRLGGTKRPECNILHTIVSVIAPWIRYILCSLCVSVFLHWRYNYKGKLISILTMLQMAIKKVSVNFKYYANINSVVFMDVDKSLGYNNLCLQLCKSALLLWFSAKYHQHKRTHSSKLYFTISALIHSENIYPH